MITISIITPCFNEEDNVETCAITVRELFKSKLPIYNYEHIFTDNNSTDSTVNKLKRLAMEDSRIKVLVNSRNVGPFKNMWNAMKWSTGDAVIPFLPADLQDPPYVIEKFVKEWSKGTLIVYGKRVNRQENIIFRVMRSFYYRLIALLAESEIPKHVGEFLLIDRKVLSTILDLDDEYPYIRGLIAQTGVDSVSIPYTWEKRLTGKSKNSFLKLLDQGINGLVSTTRAPARIALLFGFSLSILGIISSLTIFIQSLGSSTIFENASMIYALVLFVFGVNLFFLGLIGEYILSIHAQVRKSPKMYVKESINFTTNRSH